MNAEELMEKIKKFHDMSEYERVAATLPDHHASVAYLGDAVYVSYDGYQIWLSTTDGLSITNQIALEPSVYESLLIYVDRLKNNHRQQGKDKE